MDKILLAHKLLGNINEKVCCETCKWGHTFHGTLLTCKHKKMPLYYLRDNNPPIAEYDDRLHGPAYTAVCCGWVKNRNELE